LHFRFNATKLSNNKFEFLRKQMQPTATAMPSTRVEVCHDLRVAVVVLRLICGFTFQVIADILDLRKRTIIDIYNRALKRTPEVLRNSFIELVQHVDDAPRSGRPSIIPPNPGASVQLSQLFHKPFDYLLKWSTTNCRDQNGTQYS
jgi:hypothetical protein